MSNVGGTARALDPRCGGGALRCIPVLPLGGRQRALGSVRASWVGGEQRTSSDVPTMKKSDAYRLYMIFLPMCSKKEH